MSHLPVGSGGGPGRRWGGRRWEAREEEEGQRRISINSTCDLFPSCSPLCTPAGDQCTHRDLGDPTPPLLPPRPVRSESAHPRLEGRGRGWDSLNGRKRPSEGLFLGACPAGKAGEGRRWLVGPRTPAAQSLSAFVSALHKPVLGQHGQPASCVLRQLGPHSSQMPELSAVLPEEHARFYTWELLRGQESDLPKATQL